MKQRAVSLIIIDQRKMTQNSLKFFSESHKKIVKYLSSDLAFWIDFQHVILPKSRHKNMQINA
jgi:hypothetical protein